MVRHRYHIWSIAFLLALISLGAAFDKASTDNEVIRRVPTIHKVVALTFDDGPDYKTTPEILAVLRAGGVKATFFVLGQHADSHPEIVAQAVSDGHEIASHAYTHRFLSRLSKEEYNLELDKAEKAILAVAPKPVLFRPPGGAYNDEVLTAAKERGYDIILWSIDPCDWQRPSVSHIVNTVLTEVKPGSIVLMHDGQHPLPTPEAVRIIVDKLKSLGFTFVTVSELLQYREEQ